jgi:hypothetical protein
MKAVCGEAGVGKSALLAHVFAEVDGWYGRRCEVRDGTRLQQRMVTACGHVVATGARIQGSI